MFLQYVHFLLDNTPRIYLNIFYFANHGTSGRNRWLREIGIFYEYFLNKGRGVQFSLQWFCRSIEGYFTNRIICIFSIVGSTFNTQQRLSTTCCLAVAGNNAQNTCALCSLLALGSFTQHEVCVNPLLSCRALLSLVPSFLDAPRQQGLRKMNATTGPQIVSAWNRFLFQWHCLTWESFEKQMFVYICHENCFLQTKREGDISDFYSLHSLKVPPLGGAFDQTYVLNYLRFFWSSLAQLPFAPFVLSAT